MKKKVPGVLAGLVAAAVLAAPASAGPKVTVRVEGESNTLLERTQVTLPDTDSAVCGAGKKWTVADAIEVATGGDWDRQVFVSTILRESHVFADSDYWALWNGSGGGYRFATVGICDQVMAEGEEALMLVDRSPAPGFVPTSFPLSLRGLPAAVQAGVPVPLSVAIHALDGSAQPVAGATVSGGGASAVTAADGSATLTFTQPGSLVVKASKAGAVISAGERLTVSATPTTVSEAPMAPARPGLGGPSSSPPADVTAPVATIRGLESDRRFTRRRAPRELRGSVTADPSGLRAVRLSIYRKRKGRCWALDGESERFKRHRCEGRRSFRIGDRAEWSYLLPRKLAAGLFTIRVSAIDRAGNRSVTTTRIRVR